MMKSAFIDCAAFTRALTSLSPQRPPFLGVHPRTAQDGQRDAVRSWLRMLLDLSPGHPIEVSEWVNPDCRQIPHLLVLRTTVHAAPLRLCIPKAAEKVAATDVAEALARGTADPSAA
jgi:hypothetical protein